MKATADSVAAPTMNCGTWSAGSAPSPIRSCRSTTREHRHAEQHRGAVQPRIAAAQRHDDPTNSAPRIHSLRAAPYWIKPRSGPLWSSTMTSWIIVSSRCVVGSSTGIRLFSTSSSTSKVSADQRQGRQRGDPGRRGDRAVDRGQRQRAGDARQRRQGQQQGRLRQRREMQLRGSPPSPRSWSRCRAPPARSRSGRARSSPTSTIEVARKAQRRRQTAERHDRNERRDQRREIHAPARAETPSVVTSP